MKKFYLLAFAAMLFTFTSHAQVVELFKGFPANVPNPNDSFSVTIQNTDSVPMEFYLLTQFEDSDNIIFATKQTYYDHMASTGDPFGFTREMTRLVKSPYIVHLRNPEYTSYGPNGFDRFVARKQFTPCGFFLANASHMCGERENFFNHVAVETGMISADSLRIVTTEGHTLGELFHNNDTILVDTDDGEPRSLDKVPGTIDNYMSAEDIIQHRSWLDSSKRYCYTTPTRSCYELTEVSNEMYADFFTRNPVTYAPMEQFPTMDMDGKLKLLPGQSITFSYVFPTFIIDTGTAQAAQAFNDGRHAGDTVGIDALLDVFRNMFPGASDSALMTIFTKFNFAIVNGNQIDLASSVFWKEKYFATTHIPAQNRDVQIGPDMRLPMYYVSSTANNPFTLGAAPFDTVVQNSVIEIFNPDASDNSLQVESKAVQYVQQGTIPAGTTVDMKMRYNNLIYKFPAGIRAEMFGADASKLRVETYPAIATPTGVASVSKTAFTVFPNPNNGTFFVTSEDYRNLGKVDVYDVIGSKQISYQLTSPKQQLQLDLPKGIYFLKAGDTTAKVVVQ